MQVRVAGSEIINRHFIPRLTKRLNDRRGFRHVNKPPLRHLNFDLLRANRVKAGFVGDQGDKTRRVEI
ncbi:Uncharacterised protein [Enterobacter cloacae]|nr:Uncharacterised protein [Enterobacter cloacae]